MTDEELTRVETLTPASIEPEAGRWIATAREVGRLLERPFHYALALSSPLFAAFATGAQSTAATVFFGGWAAVSLLIGLAGLGGAFERPKPPPTPREAAQPLLDELARLRDLALADVEKWQKLRRELEERRRG